MPKEIKTSKLYRDFIIKRDTVNENDRTVELAFSSESAVERWFGIEILDHAKGSCDLGRLNSGGPLLMDHDPTDQIGVVESAQIGSDRVGRAIVRFGKGARADEVFKDVIDGIRTKVSVGYIIHKLQLDAQENGKPDTYRALAWEPLEISLVSIPADNSVGIGRDSAPQITTLIEGNRNMDKETTPATPPAAITAPAVDASAVIKEAREKEIQRVRDLENIGNQFQDFGGVALARQFIAEGKEVADLNAAILERIGKKAPPDATVGLTQKEKRH
jgi:hypothetical protein